MNVKSIRESVIAGSWYPGGKAALESQIDKFLANAKKEDNSGLISLISPHAGYMYSGSVAAFAYKQLEGMKINTVIIIAPSHHVPIKGASVYNKGAFRTPLGLVEIDEDLSDKLIKENPFFYFHEGAHRDEHSLEIQLPFLQRVLGNFKMVPIVMYDRSVENCKSLASSISKIVFKNSLLVASTDLSHYYSNEKAVKLDKAVIDCVQFLDPEKLSQNFDNGICEACGAGPVITTMLVSKLLGAKKSKIFKYATSGDTSGDYSRVVGYLSAGIYI
ncbi:MAG: AmmeMemoRadiSam system protein B [Candidatus Schekmanbacteria bacterium RIFCSPHIGHO2_02_FULL_38_11]|uniref:MEMO1 family protein A3G31_10335 n=1 Tax=Candidatus Schekmanbacteria bacterium RIFCSPLOWO2_12_FULL_38_15 TaxID=1817883 RepID=A0A1F7SL98_9BACT|nr:MAG: AmmeMemoRadiSam system protein B [Candidatus Schekmanbacteria bacterium GWA2_38_9]OGL47970.1 MAG: AmmeMemoRadiSam system protein B [Candidatus Schekmanbacteria bacterium RIFCSPLOWO2_02_FULL_38_14]OGL49013.1 MAG: AmmeMemoRadiSam system protein B [Candidatus Schekmanbacteria bacterium RIFCSPHIGHO2_02_FULL_38_11]OGL54545.1 MAG: AmmeMemoRadiSam system protein B [Candidatus Schekmanbacteria bacterium RIFCSPLOWO2_12_FULL_38_15]